MARSRTKQAKRLPDSTQPAESQVAPVVDGLGAPLDDDDAEQGIEFDVVAISDEPEEADETQAIAPVARKTPGPSDQSVRPSYEALKALPSDTLIEVRYLRQGRAKIAGLNVSAEPRTAPLSFFLFLGDSYLRALAESNVIAVRIVSE